MPLRQLIDNARDARMFDLSQPYFVGMPHFPTHSPYLYALAKEHGEFVLKNGGSSASETVTLSAHTGTHIDALNHFSCAGKLFGDASIQQGPGTGVRPHSVDGLAPVLRRGVLVDVAGVFAGGEPLPADFAITADHLERAARTEISADDVVLIRTGWARYFRDARKYVTNGEGVHVKAPGADEDAAKWLSARKVFAAGSDTMAFEKMPSPIMAVHVHLLVESGIHIIENLDLEQLASDAVYEFLFVAAPLKIEGGTGSPVRAFALA